MPPAIPRRIALSRIATLAAPLAWPGIARADSFWGRMLERQPTDFIFGYGSLINTASREATAGGRVHAIPARIAAAFGHLRVWNDRSASGFTALGLRPAPPGEAPTTINGVVYPVLGADMAEFDAREAGYRRIEVDRGQIEAVSWEGMPREGRIWVYMPLRDQAPDADFPLLQSYIDVVLEGGLEYGQGFAQEIVATTGGWSGHWLNDRRLARRPWVFDPLYRQVDALLAAAPHVGDRRFPETYGRGAPAGPERVPAGR